MKGILLVAVEDSPAAFAAARAAVDLAAAMGAKVVAVNVDADHRTERLAASGAVVDAARRRAEAGLAALAHVERLARQAGVGITVVQLTGTVAHSIVTEAHRCGAAMVVLARSNHRGIGMPYVGAEAQQVLEFADLPVLIIPPPDQT